jgi:8-oxo-dGTP diphosphatase
MTTNRTPSRSGHRAPRGYKFDTYPSFAVTVDMAVATIADGRLSFLLIQRSHDPYQGCWALPGGFVEPDEDTDTAAARELDEETGISITAGDGGHLEQLRTYSTPDRDPRGRIVSVAYVALIPSLPEPAAGSDASAARLWSIDEITAGVGDDGTIIQLAFDHAAILNDAVERIRAKLEYSTLATAFVEAPFTISELRHVYEAVWKVKLTPTNFHRKVLSSAGFVDAADIDTGVRRPTRGGPRAQLFLPGTARTLHPPILRPAT